MNNYRQKVLVVSENGRGAKQLPDTARDRFRFTRCAGDNQDVDFVDNGGPDYDWVLLDGGLMLGDQTDLFQSLRAMGFLISGQSYCHNNACKLEWTPNGILELHCCMRSRVHKSDTATAASAQPDDSFVFEYHAPMKKTG